MNFLRRLLNFSYLPFLIPLVRKGMYRLTTSDESGQPIITTTFYIDGDVMTALHADQDDVLAEQHPKKVEKHLRKVEARAGSMELFARQLFALFSLILALIPWLSVPLDQWVPKAAISASIVGLSFVFRKIISRLLLAGMNRFIRPLVKIPGLKIPGLKIS